MKALSLGPDDYWIFVALFFAFGNGLPNIIGVVASGVGQHESELSGAQIKLTKQ
ncbi:hypothetical protein MMC30_006963, partial [Trapelia coarctata]|nr:hypothetical protein [Trapelia coarctata]